MQHFYFLFFIISSLKTEAFNKSAGLTSSASAILKNISKENPLTIPGASMALIRVRLVCALSASCSCDNPLIFLKDEITIPNCINRSLFLNKTLILLSSHVYICILYMHESLRTAMNYLHMTCFVCNKLNIIGNQEYYIFYYYQKAVDTASKLCYN